MTTYVERLPPHDTDAETAVLGACLLGEPFYGQVKDVLTPVMWYHERHKLIWEAMVRLSKRGVAIDQITVAHELADTHSLGQFRDGKWGEAGHGDIGGPAYLSHLIAILPSTVHTLHWAGIVRDMYRRRLQITRGAELVADGFEGKRQAAPLNQGLEI